MTEPPAWPRARGLLKVEAFALISITTALRFYGFLILPANRPIGSWCACCRCCSQERSGIRGLRLAHIYASSDRARWRRHDVVWTARDVKYHPLLVNSSATSGVFRSLRMLDSPGYGYVNADARCDEHKKKSTLPDGNVSFAFYDFPSLADSVIYAREHDDGEYRDPFTHRCDHR